MITVDPLLAQYVSIHKDKIVWWIHHSPSYQKQNNFFTRGVNFILLLGTSRLRDKGLSSTGAGVPLQGPLISLKYSLSWCWNLVGPNHAHRGWTPELHTWLFLPRFDTRNFSLPQTDLWMNETKINVSNSESAKFSLPDYEFEFCPNVYWWDTSLYHLRKNV